MTSLIEEKPSAGFLEQQDSSDGSFSPRSPLEGAQERFAALLEQARQDNPLVSGEKMNMDSSSDGEAEYKYTNDDEEEYTIYTKSPSTNRIKKKPSSPAVKTTKTISTTAKKKKICDFCGTCDTPMWRRGPSGKGTLCNACGVKWSLKFRKKNGPKKDGQPTDSSKVTRKSTRKDKPSSRKSKSIPSIAPSASSQSYLPNPFTMEEEFSSEHKEFLYSPSADEDEYLPVREPKRRKPSDKETESHFDIMEGGEDEQDDSSSSSSEAEEAGNRLFGSLLNVVENKLVEVQELEEIRKEFSEWKESIEMREEQRQKNADATQNQIMDELQDFRKQIMSLLTTNEANMNSKLERVENEMHEVCRRTDMIKDELVDMKSLLSKELIAAFAAKIDGLETQMKSLQNKMEGNTEDIKTQLTQGMKQMKSTLVNDFDLSEQRISADMSSLKKRSREESDVIKRQMDRMDYLLGNNEHTTP